MIIIAALTIFALLALLLGSTVSLLRKRLASSGGRRQQLLEELPGINCAVCGYPGCYPYAEALDNNSATDLSLCTPGGAQLASKLAKILDRPLPEKLPTPMVAVVRCIGGEQEVRKVHNYQGPDDCHAEAALLDGEKSCRYSCLGRGSCVKVCPTNAISITANRLAVVDPAGCIGCEICVQECPTGVIGMIAANSRYFVACNSIEHGKTVKEKCLTGCIGCQICQHKHHKLGFRVSNNLAAVNSAAEQQDFSVDDIEKAVADCPSGCIRKTNLNKNEQQI